MLFFILIQQEFNLESSWQSKILTVSCCGFLPQQEKYMVSGFQISQRTEIKLCSLETDKDKGQKTCHFKNG